MSGIYGSVSNSKFAGIIIDYISKNHGNIKNPDDLISIYKQKTIGLNIDYRSAYAINLYVFYIQDCVYKADAHDRHSLIRKFVKTQLEVYQESSDPSYYRRQYNHHDKTD